MLFMLFWPWQLATVLSSFQDDLEFCIEMISWVLLNCGDWRHEGEEQAVIKVSISRCKWILLDSETTCVTWAAP